MDAAFPNNPDSIITLIGMLRRRAEQQPQQVAFSFLLDGETVRGSLTYAELDQRARAIAAWLQSAGLAGARALLLYPPGLEYICAFFGCLYAGVVAVPAYPPRRNRSLHRLQAIATDARATVALTTPAVFALVEEMAARTTEWPGVRWFRTDQVPKGIEQTWREPALTEDSLAFLQYTSGSTAAPKGVMLTHGNLLHNLAWIQHCCQHTPLSRGMVWLPPYHDMGLIGGILQPLYAGFPCYLMSPVSFFSGPYSWLQAVSRFRASTSGGPNFAYDLCLRRITAEQRASLDLTCWQAAFCGAEPVRAETLERFAATFAPCGFRREALLPCYGLAEATLMVAGREALVLPSTLAVHRAALESGVVVAAPAGSLDSQTFVGCGPGLPDQQLLIMHPETLMPCNPDQVGEVWLSGPSVAQGYWGRPDETRQVFQAARADTGEGPFLRTGDLAFVHNGELFITGRLKDLIIIRGRNLYPQDLEQTVQQSHPTLEGCLGAAFSVQVGDEERLAIVHEVNPRQDLDFPTVVRAVRQAVADEHDVEVYSLTLVKMGSIPKTSSGKIQRRACRNELLAGTLALVDQWRETGTRGELSGLTRAALLALPPAVRRSRLQAYFQDQFARILRLEPSQLDVHHSVSAFGLSSLTVLELKHGIEDGLGVSLPVAGLLQGPTIAQLAQEVSEQFSAAAPASDLHRLARLLGQVDQLSDAEPKMRL